MWNYHVGCFFCFFFVKLERDGTCWRPINYFKCPEKSLLGGTGDDLEF